MKLDEYQQRLKVAIALGEGKAVEAHCPSGTAVWRTIGFVLSAVEFSPQVIFDDNYEVRVKPTPRLVPWSSVAEVPVNDWFKPKHLSGVIQRVEMIDGNGDHVICLPTTGWQTYQEIFDKMEHAADPINGKWEACGKLEG